MSDVTLNGIGMQGKGTQGGTQKFLNIYKNTQQDAPVDENGDYNECVLEVGMVDDDTTSQNLGSGVQLTYATLAHAKLNKLTLTNEIYQPGNYLMVDADGNSIVSTDILSSMNIVAENLTVSGKAYFIPKEILSESSVSINLNESNHFEIDLTLLSEIDIEMKNPEQGQTGLIILKHNQEITPNWTSSNSELKWQGGTSPNLVVNSQGTDTHTIIKYFCFFDKILMNTPSYYF